MIRLLSGLAGMLAYLVTSPVNAMPVEYTGELIDGTTVLSAVSSTGGVDDPTAGIYFWFSGNAGDIVSITVARLEQDLDPAMWLFEGRIDDTIQTREGVGSGFDKRDAGFLRHADDELAHEGGFGDPQIADFVLPTTGYYTAIVTNFLSRSDGDDGWFEFAIACKGCGGESARGETDIAEPGIIAILSLGLVAGALVLRRRRRS